VDHFVAVQVTACAFLEAWGEDPSRWEAHLNALYAEHYLKLSTEFRPEMMEVGRSLLLGETTFSPEMVKAREGRPMDGTAGVTVRNGVAVIDIVGPIFRYADFFTAMCGGATVESLAQDLQSALANSNVSAILLHIDSPGGQAAGIGELAGMIREGTTKKPIVAYVGSEGASAAYWLASAASEIVAAPSALLGSIGVVMAYPRKKDDPKSIEFVSSQSPMKRPDVSTPDGREEIQGTVDAMAKVFIDSVAEYRATNPEKVAAANARSAMRRRKTPLLDPIHAAMLGYVWHGNAWIKKNEQKTYANEAAQ
jgi:ClpP class serine protease